MHREKSFHSVWKGLLLLVLLLGSGSSEAAATTYMVAPDGSGDFATIQEAINAAVSGDVIELTNGTFVGTGNRDLDYDGKGITVRSQSDDPTLCIIDCQATPTDRHRGVYFHSDDSAQAVLRGITITNGYVATVGGAIRVDACAPTIRNCRLIGNQATDDAGEAMGGAVAGWNGGSPTLIDCVFENNSSQQGGGIYCVEAESLRIVRCSFTDCNARDGGGVYIQGSSVVIDSSLFRANHAVGGYGGAAELLGNTDRITNCLFWENTAVYSGGALDLGLGLADTLRSCVFTENVSYTGGGGGAYVQFSNVLFHNCAFTSNSAPMSGGGGLWVAHETEAFLLGCYFRQNEGTWGGGMRCRGPNTVEIAGTIFAENHATMPGGGLVAEYNADVSIRGTTFYANQTNGGGSGICAINGTSVVLERVIISHGIGNDAVVCTSQTVSCSCCDIFGNEGGDWTGEILDQYGIDGNISEDPLFCDAPAEDYQLQAGSPCAPNTPPNPECGLIGAWQVGCDPTMVDDGPSGAGPEATSLRGFPNPFAGNVGLTYELPAGAAVTDVRLEIFDPAGRSVRVLVNEAQVPGEYAVRWDGRDAGGRPLPNGVYHCRLQAGGLQLSGRLLHLR